MKFQLHQRLVWTAQWQSPPLVLRDLPEESGDFCSYFMVLTPHLELRDFVSSPANSNALSAT
jgi:hypothetical protein